MTEVTERSMTERTRLEHDQRIANEILDWWEAYVEPLENVRMQNCLLAELLRMYRGSYDYFVIGTQISRLLRSRIDRAGKHHRLVNALGYYFPEIER